MRILVTGANGFIGSAVTQDLLNRRMVVVSVTRRDFPGSFAIGEIDGSTNWSSALAGCDAVVHTAARVQQVSGANVEEAYNTINVDGTINLARQAAQLGVKRFIFLSSIKAMGEAGHFKPDDECLPEDAYGKSKLLAEQELRKIAAETDMEIVILRLPIVYGAGMKGNFLALFRAVEKGIPLPFRAVKNARSLLYLGNLTDVISLCLTSENAKSRVWLPSDTKAISTSKLLLEIGAALGKTPRLLRIPSKLLAMIANLIGKRHIAERLLGSLTVDSAALLHELGWTPQFTLEQGLQETARWYQESRFFRH